MMWLDYNIHQAGDNFRIEGDWPGEVMGLSKDGKSKDGKENPLYRPGDVFRVEENGWLTKIESASKLCSCPPLVTPTSVGVIKD
jgi:hypothetical protein